MLTLCSGWQCISAILLSPLANIKSAGRLASPPACLCPVVPRAARFAVPSRPPLVIVR